MDQRALHILTDRTKQQRLVETRHMRTSLSDVYVTVVRSTVSKHGDNTHAFQQIQARWKSTNGP